MFALLYRSVYVVNMSELKASLNLRIKIESKERLQALANKMDIKLADVARMAMGRGLTQMEREQR